MPWSLKKMSKPLSWSKIPLISLIFKHKFSQILWLTFSIDDSTSSMKGVNSKGVPKVHSTTLWQSVVFQKQTILLSLGLCNSTYTVLCTYDFVSLNMTHLPGNCIAPCKILTPLSPSLAIHSLGLHQAAPQSSLLQMQHIAITWSLAACGEAVFW